jgi:Kef-type K+ transport system membrane component KefB
MDETHLVFTVFLIFSGAAVLSTLALFTRQSMLIAYIVLGVLLGPWGLSNIFHVTLVGAPQVINAIGDIGIIFLLFLLGLHLPPQKLVQMLKEMTWVGLGSSFIFLVLGYGCAYLFGFDHVDSVIIGAAVMFSSTIIGIKLLPTTVLHHQHTGEVMIGVLLFQDIIAIIVLLCMRAAESHGAVLHELKYLLIGFPLIILISFGVERFVLLKLFKRFDSIREYIFLVSIGWCLGLAELAEVFHLSAEIGAFLGGVTLAASPISLYIAESLKPVRDFFLVMFFFSIGASFNVSFLHSVWLPSLVIAAVFIVVKPFVYTRLLTWVGETKQVSWEVGCRLAQLSEFSLIISFVAQSGHLISDRAVYTIQAATILTFIVSSYYIVMKYPTPVATNEKLRRD